MSRLCLSTTAQLITDTSVPGDQYLFNITALVNDVSYYAVVTAKSTAGDSTPAQSSTERLPVRVHSCGLQQELEDERKCFKEKSFLFIAECVKLGVKTLFSTSYDCLN